MPNKPLRIGIDAHMVGERETGNETYIVNLVRSLSDIDSVNHYLLYSPHPESLDACGTLGSNFKRRRLNVSQSAVRIPFEFPMQTFRDEVDISHLTYISPPVIRGGVIATVHDISYVLHPDTFSLRDRTILGTLVPRTLQSADAIITVSESSRKDIIEHYGTPEHKVHVVYQPISNAFRVIYDQRLVSQAMARIGVKWPYILAVGNLQPRKNLLRLIRAYALLRQRRAYDGKLVLVGKNKWRESGIFKEISDLNLEEDVHFTGYVTEEDLVALYNAADVFVYPSIYEGYGLPPLEAMACGCPVVTGNTSSLPEVVGDAGIMVDPYAEEAFAWAIERLTKDNFLRNTLVKRGLVRVRRFQPHQAAYSTLRIYYQVAQSRGLSPDWPTPQVRP